MICQPLGMATLALWRTSATDYEDIPLSRQLNTMMIHPDAVVKNADSLHCLASFMGETSWTQGNGDIPLILRHDQDTEFDLDIQDADFKKDVNAPLLSM